MYSLVLMFISVVCVFFLSSVFKLDDSVCVGISLAFAIIAMCINGYEAEENG